HQALNPCARDVMAVTKERFIARLAPPPCDGLSGPGLGADIARSTDPYDGQGPPLCTSVGRRSPPTGSIEQPHVAGPRGGYTLKDGGRDGGPARLIVWAE